MVLKKIVPLAPKEEILALAEFCSLKNAVARRQRHSCAVWRRATATKSNLFKLFPLFLKENRGGVFHEQGMATFRSHPLLLKYSEIILKDSGLCSTDSGLCSTNGGNALFLRNLQGFIGVVNQKHSVVFNKNSTFFELLYVFF